MIMIKMETAMVKVMESMMMAMIMIATAGNLTNLHSCVEEHFIILVMLLRNVPASNASWKLIVSGLVVFSILKFSTATRLPFPSLKREIFL